MSDSTTLVYKKKKKKFIEQMSISMSLRQKMAFVLSKRQEVM